MRPMSVVSAARSAFLLTIASAVPATAQTAAFSTEADISIERGSPGPGNSGLFGPSARFFPGQRVVFSIEGTATPHRHIDYKEECSTRIIWCISKRKYLDVVGEINATAAQLPVLIQVRPATSAFPAGPISPAPAPQPAYTGSPEPFIALGPVREISFGLPDATRGEELASGYELRGYIADRHGGVTTRRNLCAGLTPGVCGTGGYRIRIIEVDSGERLSRVVSLLNERRMQASSLDRLIDFWLRNRVGPGGRVEPNGDATRALAEALVQQAEKFHPEASQAPNDRRAILQAALSLDPNNPQAQSFLVSHLVRSGNYVEAQQQLNQDFPKRRAAYEEIETLLGSNSAVPATPVLLYARSLVDAGLIARGRAARTLGSDVNAAIAFFGEAKNVLERLRRHPPGQVTWASGSGPAEARDQYLAVLDDLASTQRLLPWLLEDAAKTLRDARSLFPRRENGAIVAFGSDGRSALIADAPLRFTSLTSGSADASTIAGPVTPPAAPVGGAPRQPEFTVDVSLLPAEVRAVLGSQRLRHVVSRMDGELAVWEEGPFGQRFTALDRLAGVTRIAIGTDGILATTISAGQVNYVAFGQNAPDLARARLATLSVSGRFAWSEDGRTIRLGDAEFDFGTESLAGATDLAVEDSDRSQPVIAVARVRNDSWELVMRRGQTEAVVKPLGPLAAVPLHSNRLVVSSGGRAVFLADDLMCVVTTDREAMPSCRRHGVNGLADRLVRPGLMMLDGDRVAFVLAGMRNASGAAVVLNLNASLPDQGTEWRATAGWRELQLGRLEVPWADAFAAPAASTEGGVVRLRLFAATVAANLQTVSLPDLTVRGALREEAFSGAGYVGAGAQTIFVVDRTTGRLRPPGAAQGQGPFGPGDYLADPTGAGFFVLRDNAGTPTAVARAKPDGTAEVQATQLPLACRVAGVRVVRAPSADHGGGQQQFVFLAPAGGSGVRSHSACIFVPAENAFTQTTVRADDPSRVIAVVRSVRFGALAVEHTHQGVVVRRPDGSALTGEPLLRAWPAAIAAPSPEALLAEADDVQANGQTLHRLFLRIQDQATGRGEIALLRIPEREGRQPEVVSWSFDTAPVAAATATAALPLHGVGQPVPGFIDARRGILALPLAAGCIVVGITDEAAASGLGEAWQYLPEAVQPSPLVIAGPRRVLLGRAGVVEVAGGDEARKLQTRPGDIAPDCAALAGRSF